MRAWGDHKKLDLNPTPFAYKTWRQRALDCVSRDKDGGPRPDVRALLIWAESRHEEISDDIAEAGAREVGLREVVQPVAAALYPGIRAIIADALMPRAERCSSGLELRRRLYLVMRGSSPQISMVQAEQFAFPPRAPSMAALWDCLQKWEALGAEVESSGFECPAWMRAAAILRLVPRDLEQRIIARPELRSFEQRLARSKPRSPI